MLKWVGRKISSSLVVWHKKCYFFFTLTLFHCFHLPLSLTFPPSFSAFLLFLLISLFILLSLSHSLTFSVYLLSSSPVTLLSVCTCSSKEFLVIARKCGSITRYSLPHLNTENTYNVRSEPFRWNQEVI